MPTRNKKRAAYQKLALELREAILSGKMQPGEKLLGELVLARKYNMSRTTVRLAVKELEKDSLVYRRRGSGTFVAAKPNTAPVTRSVFSDFVRGLSHRIVREVRESRWVDADTEAARDLEIPADAPLLWFRRVDSLDNRPMACDEGWIYGPYAENLDESDLATLEFFEHWQRKGKVRVAKSVLEIAALPADPEIAALLDIEEGTPVLMEKDTIFTADHGTAKFITHYRYDTYRFKGVYYNTRKA